MKKQTFQRGDRVVLLCDYSQTHPAADRLLRKGDVVTVEGVDTDGDPRYTTCKGTYAFLPRSGVDKLPDPGRANRIEWIRFIASGTTIVIALAAASSQKGASMDFARQVIDSPLVVESARYLITLLCGLAGLHASLGATRSVARSLGSVADRHRRVRSEKARAEEDRMITYQRQAEEAQTRKASREKARRQAKAEKRAARMAEVEALGQRVASTIAASLSNTMEENARKMLGRSLEQFRVNAGLPQVVPGDRVVFTKDPGAGATETLFSPTGKSSDLRTAKPGDIVLVAALHADPNYFLYMSGGRTCCGHVSEVQVVSTPA